jgi:hypothetical protein
MPDYSLGKIYKIVSDQYELPYIGSTCNPYLSVRMANHRSDFKRHLHKSAHYVSSFEILQYGDAKIILIENFPCKNKDELTQRERYYIENIECVNKVIPGQTNKEWCEKNKDKEYEKGKRWRNKNKEKLVKQRKEFYQTNKIRINKAHQEYCKKKITCDYCDIETDKGNLSRHNKTPKHINNVNISTDIFNNLI